MHSIQTRLLGALLVICAGFGVIVGYAVLKSTERRVIADAKVRLARAADRQRAHLGDELEQRVTLGVAANKLVVREALLSTHGHDSCRLAQRVVDQAEAAGWARGKQVRSVYVVAVIDRTRQCLVACGLHSAAHKPAHELVDDLHLQPRITRAAVGQVAKPCPSLSHPGDNVVAELLAGVVIGRDLDPAGRPLVGQQDHNGGLVLRAAVDVF